MSVPQLDLGPQSDPAARVAWCLGNRVWLLPILGRPVAFLSSVGVQHMNQLSRKGCPSFGLFRSSSPCLRSLLPVALDHDHAQKRANHR